MKINKTYICIILKSKKNIFGLLIFTIVISLATVFYVTNKKKDITRIKPKVSLSSNELIHLFVDNEKQATKTYANTVIEVSGIVKEISFLNDKTTIILEGLNEDSNIICEMSELNLPENLPKKNTKIFIKGVCKGFLKDVILLNCTIVKE